MVTQVGSAAWVVMPKFSMLGQWLDMRAALFCAQAWVSKAPGYESFGAEFGGDPAELGCNPDPGTGNVQGLDHLPQRLAERAEPCGLDGGDRGAGRG
jgi:hypothetical protein